MPLYVSTLSGDSRSMFQSEAGASCCSSPIMALLHPLQRALVLNFNMVVWDYIFNFLRRSELDTTQIDDSAIAADAIDTVAPKVELMRRCVEQEIPLISSMGAGGRLDPSQVCYGTLATTQGDGLARTLRTRLRKMNVAINNIEVVWSRELPERRAVIELMEQNKRSSFGTLATIPALFGIYMANKIIREITGI